MKNQIFTLKCFELNSFGFGVCKIDDFVVFVKDMIPDDVAEIKIISVKKTYGYGIITKMIKPSSDRIEPDCSCNRLCGGCNLRHLNYDKELIYKKEYLSKMFKDYEVMDVVPCTKDRYRNKVQVPVAMGKFGFYRNHSHDIVEFDDCKLQSELANKIIMFLKDEIKGFGIEDSFKHIFLRHFETSNEVMVAYIVNDDNVKYLKELTERLTDKFKEIKSVILNVNKNDDNVIINYDFKDVVLYGNNYITDKVNDLSFKVTFKSFYQVNHEMMIKLYSYVKTLLKEVKAKNVLELYSGIGTIGLFVSDACLNIKGVEIIEDAVGIAKENAKINNLKYLATLSDAKDGLDKQLKGIDTVIVDPPRKGLDQKVIETLAGNNIKSVIYVSCGPEALKRDLNIFKELGYNISPIKPFDMFKRTVHVENVVLLSKNI